MGHTYDAALYALVHRGTPGDVAFYAEACRGARSVLELGCGYGRLIPALSRAGRMYRGLELDAGLLREAKRVRRGRPVPERAFIRLSRGDMRRFAFRERYDRILIPHSALYCLPSERDVLACLRCVREHLTDGGALILDAYCADAFHGRLDERALTGRERDLLTEVEAGGVRYQVFERTRWVRRAQRLWVRYEYESAGAPRRVGTIRHHYLLRDQLEALLRRAGLSVLHVYGGFAGERWRKNRESVVLYARAG